MFASISFIAAIALLITGIILKLYNKDNTAIFILFLSALCIRLFAAHLDPFLHDWDEKFHALVARNMMSHPFIPTLRENPLYEMDYRAWCCNHIWVHKQPLFMWQMALSMKIFGVSEYAIRYPSVLMGAIMVLLTYRVAILFFKNNTIAFTAALFMCLSNYQFELTSGYFGMDHNDVAFGFYVLASIWSYAEYSVNKKWKWAVLIGVFAGCAILNKWLTGLLVYSGWGINILLNIRKQGTRKEIIQILVSLLVCTTVFLPWQLYIHHAFPKEALYEMQYNTRHITEVIEGHDGNTMFYLDRLTNYFGIYTWWLLPVGIIIALFTKRHHHIRIISSLSYILIVFIFFSLVVRSKLDSYVFPVAPLGYIYIWL